MTCVSTLEQPRRILHAPYNFTSPYRYIETSELTKFKNNGLVAIKVGFMACLDKERKGDKHTS